MLEFYRNYISALFAVRFVLPTTLPSEITKNDVYNLFSIIAPSLVTLHWIVTSKSNPKNKDSNIYLEKLVAAGTCITQIIRQVIKFVDTETHNTFGFLHKFDISYMHLNALSQGFSFKSIPKPTEIIYHFLAIAHLWLPLYSLEFFGAPEILAATGMLLSSFDLFNQNKISCGLIWSTAFYLHAQKPFGDTLSSEITYCLLILPQYILSSKKPSNISPPPSTTEEKSKSL